MGWVKEVFEIFGKVKEEVKGGNYIFGKDKLVCKMVECKGLVVKFNVDGFDYEEWCGDLLVDKVLFVILLSLCFDIEFKDY